MEPSTAEPNPENLPEAPKQREPQNRREARALKALQRSKAKLKAAQNRNQRGSR